MALGILSLILIIIAIVTVTYYVSQNNIMTSKKITYPPNFTSKTYVIEPKSSQINQLNSIKTQQKERTKTTADSYEIQKSASINYDYGYYDDYYDNNDYNTRYVDRGYNLLQYKYPYYHYTFNGTYDEDIYRCITYNKHSNNTNSTDCWKYMREIEYKNTYRNYRDYDYSWYNPYRYYSYAKYNQRPYYNGYDYGYNPNNYDYDNSNQYTYDVDYYDYNRYYDRMPQYEDESYYREREFWLTGAYNYYPDTKRHLLLNDYYKYHNEDGSLILQEG